jgi:hypothetical protein
MGKLKKPGGGVSSFKIARPAFLTWWRLHEKSVNPPIDTGRFMVTSSKFSVLLGGRSPVKYDCSSFRTSRWISFDKPAYSFNVDFSNMPSGKPDT